MTTEEENLLGGLGPGKRSGRLATRRGSRSRNEREVEKSGGG
jgi:hypothetical protein